VKSFGCENIAGKENETWINCTIFPTPNYETFKFDIFVFHLLATNTACSFYVKDDSLLIRAVNELSCS
jgi:hypothetical protein